MDIKNRCLNPVAVPRLTGSARVFRCGQCPNCLRQKANELAVRAYREYNGQNLVFLTFTYDNDHMPMFNYELTANVHTGEYVERSWISRGGSFFKEAPFTMQRKNERGYVGRRFYPYKKLYEDNPNMHKLEVQYFTTYYEDVKLLFKRFRERYPGALKHFICVPEYGAVTYRPHYHMLAYGLSKQMVEDLVDDWQNKQQFGHVDVQYPSAKVGADMHSQVQKIGSYIAKYCTKGKYDCPYIKRGFCQKPRRAISQNFGIGQDFDKLKSIVLCTDTLGITDPWFNDDCPPDLNKKALALLVQQRKMRIGNAESMPFPKYLLNKIFKKTVRVERYITKEEDLPFVEGFRNIITHYDYKLTEVKHGEKNPCPKGVKVSYKSLASPLQKEITRYLLADLVHDALRKQGESARSLQDAGQVHDYYESLSRDEEATAKAVEAQFISDMYNHSIY